MLSKPVKTIIRQKQVMIVIKGGGCVTIQYGEEIKRTEISPAQRLPVHSETAKQGYSRQQ